MLKKAKITMRTAGLALAFMMVPGASLLAQTTTNGTINATLINKSGIILIFDSAPAGTGVPLGNTGTSNAMLNFGAISAFGPLAAGVTRPSVTAGSFTVSTTFDIQVQFGGGTSTSYKLAANLAAAPPAGFSYSVDGTALTTAAQQIQTTESYNVDIPHTLNLTVSTGAAAGSQSATINFTATSN